MADPIPWEFFVSEMGRPVVQKELEKLKLTADESHQFSDILYRSSHQRAKTDEVKYLGRDIWELRIRCEHRILRLLYFTVSTPTRHIAVLVAVKKVQKTPSQWIELALHRKKSWEKLEGVTRND